MKHNTESISESIFTHFPSSNTIRSTRNLSRATTIKGKQGGTLFSTPSRQIILLQQSMNRIYKVLKKGALTYKAQAQSGVATLGIGIALLLTAYLFLTQLAEHGWQ